MYNVHWHLVECSVTQLDTPALTKKYLDVLLLCCKAALGSRCHIQERDRRMDFVRVFSQQVSALLPVPSSVLPHHALLMLVALGSESRALEALLLLESSQP